MSQNVQQLASFTPMVVNYTGLTTDHSTAVAADLPVGGVVCMYGVDDDGTIRVCRPATAVLGYPKFIVVSMPANVNDIITGSQRRGGLISVVPAATAVGCIQTLVAASQAAGDLVGAADGVFAATTISDSSNDTIAEQARYIGRQRAASTPSAVVDVIYGGF